MPSPQAIRTLTAADIPQVLGLAHAAGWTQTGADIERMLAYTPGGCFGLELPAGNSWPGGVASTAMGFSHGRELGWVAMVLTHPSLRGQGLGSLLTQHATGYLRSLGTWWIKLDASDLGRPIYQRLGFREENVMERRLRNASTLPARISGKETSFDTGGSLPLALDRRAFGADRARLLGMLSAIESARTASLPDGRGYAILRPGRRGMQLGPMVAADVADAESLLRWAIAEAGDATLQWDLIRENEGARGLADAYGFQVDRVLHRMALPGVDSPPPFGGSVDLVYSIAGFDFG